MHKFTIAQLFNESSRDTSLKLEITEEERIRSLNRIWQLNTKTMGVSTPIDNLKVTSLFKPTQCNYLIKTVYLGNSSFV